MKYCKSGTDLTVIERRHEKTPNEESPNEESPKEESPKEESPKEESPNAKSPKSPINEKSPTFKKS